MSQTAVILSLLCATVIIQVHSLPTGAPEAACTDITPEPGHGGSPQDPATIPYGFNTASEFGSDNAGFYYLPGRNYFSKCRACTLLKSVLLFPNGHILTIRMNYVEKGALL